MTNTAAKFINKHGDLIDDSKIEELYEEMYQDIQLTYEDRCAITSALLSIDINPWEYDIPLYRINVRNGKFTKPLTIVSRQESLPDFNSCEFSDLTLKGTPLSSIRLYDCTIQNLHFDSTYDTLPPIVCKSITNIDISESITDIDSHAFRAYEGQSVILPETVLDIHQSAFRLSHVARVELPVTIDVIPKECFAYCSNLSVLKLPSSIEYIGKDAFLDTRALETIHFAGTTEAWANIAIYRDAFNGSALKEIVCSDGVVKFKKGK